MRFNFEAREFLPVSPQTDRPFYFEVQVLDDKGIRRRFKASNTQSTMRVKPFLCGLPLKLSPGWNQVNFDLATLTNKAFGESHACCLL
jgi:Protein of unknown function (DUF667)